MCKGTFKKKKKTTTETAQVLADLRGGHRGLQDFLRAEGSVRAISKMGIEQSLQESGSRDSGGQVPKRFSHLFCGRVGLWSN